MKAVIDLKPYLPQYIAAPTAPAPSRSRRCASGILTVLEGLLSLGIGLGFFVMFAAMLSVI